MVAAIKAKNEAVMLNPSFPFAFETIGNGPVDAEYDLPDTVDDQLRWMADAGLTATVTWQCGDLAVMVAERTS